MASKAFNHLKRSIDREYRREGMPPERALYIATATAGKVAREKKAKQRRKKRRRHGKR